MDLTIINVFPLVGDLKNEIKNYLIPRPPPYKQGYVKRVYVVDSYTGERITLNPNINFYGFNSNGIKNYNTHIDFYEFCKDVFGNKHQSLHSCHHISYSNSNYNRATTPCFWCR